MSTPVQRGFQWAVLVTAALVVIGVFVQVYLIGAYIFGAGQDALDAHKDLGNVVFLIALLGFLAGIGAYGKRWGDLAWPFALAVVATIQVSFASGDDWVGGFHAVFALLDLILAAIVTHRTMRHLGLGHGTAPG